MSVKPNMIIQCLTETLTDAKNHTQNYLKKSLLFKRASIINTNNPFFLWFPCHSDNIDQFFEQLQKAASNHHERKEQLKLEVENVSSNVKFKSYVEVSPCPPAAMVCENEEERNKLYCEILYTIKHKIGKTISGYHVNDTDDLMEYAREAFPGVTTEEHEKLHTAVCEKKPPVLVLTVQVLEASDLVAKDANGLSDPYW